MNIFQTRASQLIRESAFFPDAISREQVAYADTSIATTGVWTAYRFVIGNLANVRNTIETVAQRYSTTRHRYEYIDAHEMFENLDSVQSTRLMYHDYAGRLSVNARDSAFAIDQDGRRFSLDRGQNCGFRGVVTKTQSSWSLEAYCMRELARARHRLLNLGQNTFANGLTIDHPFAVRQALEVQLQDLYQIAWAEYLNEPTPDRLVTLQQTEQAIHSYVLQTMHWVQNVGHMDYMSALPTPDLAQSEMLWKTGRLDAIDYDQAAPWMFPCPELRTWDITACRRAEITNGRVFIDIIPTPQIVTLEHAFLGAAKHQITYGPHQATIQQCDINPAVAGRDIFSGPGGGRTNYWRGDNLVPIDGWTAMTSEPNLPEPKLKVHERTVALDRGVAERLESALLSDRPTVIQVPVNQGVAPVLVLPYDFYDVEITPLYTGGIQLVPTHEGNTVAGWTTHTADQELVAVPLQGFRQVPSTGYPVRAGNLSEIIRD